MSEIFQDPDYLRHLEQSVRRETHGKTVHRRHFLQLLSALGIGTGTLGFVASASAQQKELVVANWGGDALAVHRDVLAAEFAKRYPGSRVAFDTTGPTPGKIKAMVESGNIAWDVADRNLLSALELGRQGLLEKVDESIVDINAVPSQFRTEWGVGSYLFSYVIAYDTARFGAAPPRTWKDFWDTQNFKGKRALRNNVEGILESALLADGVARDKLYPLDVARGLEKVRAIKKDTIFYNNASDAQQLLRSGEVSAGSLWSTRAQGVKEDTKGRVDYHFNEGILLIAAWNVLKGAKNSKDAWRWVALSQDPALQVVLLARLGWGPVNPAANKLVPAELQGQNPGSPENVARQIAVDAEWYARNYFEVQNKYLDVLAT
ncbi:ABC transporter substrate-binding protein [Bradyrhizobium sp. U87765 SZCCT0131]|uniref:ABC transporter substrate-binding protein n=1 Tax=unclassified Bradyrhizobium TaxID=2631580 RepID=UPI001BAB874E|nr:MULTISPECIES: ABC transporter substrate-binding protein [unclassified Bradyrhizobium]MBR1221525.1 ABC transporter substrate-binding protein [Bradyrhizobium sp. U87765 SZCCT0131]MBR1264552.1 ABC transporter substrate-binding protein [Bradyrhizobium sp. U87765 SZCCT0134]MBR1304542.1 ABC transporter substrate-binding protein [Bradyrhizobium sp. U87765 SZCCT0110]MBR1322601.1 ABC transporter substrate-binding protein [Bradyrhizobium sp. U87765 SZCCT0109]MBR1346471.1 ABC transporter substrate-bin